MPKSKITYTCCGKKISSRKLMKSHLELFHKINTETQMFEQKQLVHMDGPTWYSSTYEMSGGGVTFQIDTWNERDDEGKLLWMDDIPQPPEEEQS